ncbi:MAG: ABC transporter permease, partial [Pseudomonadota bacterium]
LVGYVVGVALAHVIIPFFPRRVVKHPSDMGLMLLVVLLVGLLAAQLGIARAMKAKPQDVLS